MNPPKYYLQAQNRHRESRTHQNVKIHVKLIPESCF